jgi:parallel beta-helix repeat protein
VGSHSGAGSHWRRCAAVGALLISGAIVVPPSSVSADQVACGEVLTTSVTLGNSLSACAGDGLVIGASGITVDLNGHSIDGVGLGVGIRNDGHDDVTVRNGAVSQFDHGVVLSPGTTRNTVAGISFAETEWSAIQLNGATANQLHHNSVNAFSDVGIHFLNGSSGNLLADTTVGTGNGESIVVETGSDHNRLQGNTVSESSDTSIRVHGSAHTTIIGNRIAGGSDVAVLIEGAPETVVQSNDVGGVGDAGVLISEGWRNVVRFNALRGSADAGIILSTVGDSLVKANTIADAGDAGIVLRLGSSGNRVIDNQADHSSDAGIFVGDGDGNVVRGNVLPANTTGIELSGGQRNVVEFNEVRASLGTGIELGGSTHNTVFGNTTIGNLQGGIAVDDASLANQVAGNEASQSGGDGITVSGAGTVVKDNLAAGNQGWGIYARVGVVDGRGNGARGNAEAAQCHLIACSDGAGWQKPVRPPEPLDPLEVGVEGPTQPPRRVRSLRRKKPRAAVMTVRCKPRGGGRASGRGRARRKAGVVCKASFKARRGSRRLTGRLIRDDGSYAKGTRRVRPGRRGTLALRARKRPRAGRYMLVLAFSDARGRATVVRKAVRVR